jgi:hypothetical protein
MSSGDYIDLLNMRNCNAHGTTSGSHTQSVMMNTITSNANNYFQVPFCNTTNHVIPGYSSIGITGLTGHTGPLGIGPTGPVGIGVEGPPGLSLEYNLFLSPSQTIFVPDISGDLIADPSMNAIQS